MNKKLTESFFSYIRMILAAYPNEVINENFIYSNIIRFNIPKSEDYSLKKHFNDWIEYFKNRKNIEVFNSNSWKYFCQFENYGKTNFFKTNCIKIYIPVDEKHIRNAAIMIFDYLERNNIEHVSKIGSDVRQDDIVIRVDNIFAAEKIRHFINNNDYIKEGLMEGVPFGFNEGVINFAYDDCMSFNSYLSQTIAEFINYMRKNNSCDKINSDNFKNYLINLYDRVFVKKTYLKEYSKTIKDKSDKLATRLNNCKEMLDLIIKMTDENFNIGKFYESWQKANDKNLKNLSIVDIDNYLNAGVSEDEEITEDNKINDVKKAKLLIEAIKVSYEKYGYDFTFSAIRTMVEKHNYNGITRENGARASLINNIDINTVKSLIESIIGKYDIDEFIKYSNKIPKFDCLDLLINASVATYTKYGESQLKFALNRSLTKKFEGFTNDNNLRKNLKEAVENVNIINLIRTFLLEKNYSIGEINNNEINLYIGEIKMLCNENTIGKTI